MPTFNAFEARKAQAKYCERTGAPHFAPKSGICRSCNSNIYEKKETVCFKGTERERKFESGVSVEKSADRLITGCPHCSRSYCD